MSQEIKVTFIDSNDWKLPFNFAIGLHLLLILSAIYLPQFLHRKPLFPDIYTIDLINISDQSFKELQVPPVQPTSKINENINPPENAVPISEKTPAPEIVPVDSQPISIKPLKRKKLRKPIKKPLIQPKKNLEKLHKKHLDEVREAERLAEEAARLAASEAVNHLKQMLLESNNIETATPPKPATPSPTTTVHTNSNVIESQYFASIINKLQPYWSLPEYKTLDPELMAIVIIQVEQNGVITKQFFEKRSGDRLFDQFVLKTLQEGSPLPLIPPALQKNTLEIGLRFRPGGIQY